MFKQKNYKKTLTACYLGFVTQAITANFTPLLFLTFRETYGIDFEKLALIPVVFYLTQLLVDMAAAKFADKIGYRLCVIGSQVLSSAGLLSLTILPDLHLEPLTGILIAVMLYAIGSGLIEVLVSPIVEACPFENKDGIMSLLHSFYCWGAVCVILGSTLFFARPFFYFPEKFSPPQTGEFFESQKEEQIQLLEKFSVRNWNFILPQKRV